MAKSCNQKSKILYLERLFMESTEEKALSMQAIITFLEEKGIRAERKSIYDDMEALRSFGMNIQYRRGKQGGYYLGPCDLSGVPKMQQPEMEDQTPEGEKERESFQAEKISKHTQMAEEMDTRMQTEKKLPEFIVGNPQNDGRQVKLLFRKAVKEEVVKTLGTEAAYKEKGENGFSVTLQVEENAQFYGWLASFGKNVHILKPKKAAIAYREYLKSIIKDYKGIEK